MTNDDTVDARPAARIAERFEIQFETCLFNRFAFLNLGLKTDLYFISFQIFKDSEELDFHVMKGN